VPHRIINIPNPYIPIVASNGDVTTVGTERGIHESTLVFELIYQPTR